MSVDCLFSTTLLAGARRQVEPLGGRGFHWSVHFLLNL